MQDPNDSKRLQSDLNVLQEWEKKWDMELNPSKCQVLHITRSRNPIRYKYTMHGQILESVENARYLGVDISSDLGFSHHIHRITSNAQKNLGFLKRNIKTTHSGIRELIKQLFGHSLSTPLPLGVLTQKKTHTRLRWCRGGQSLGYAILILTMTVLLLCSQIYVSGHWSRGGSMQVSSCFIK